MENLAGYEVTASICKTEDFVVYRATKKGDSTGKPVLIKVPASKFPSPSAIRQLEHEYQAAHDLDPAFIVRPLGLERNNGGLILVMEDGGATKTLEDCLAGPMPLGLFLKIAIRTAAALVEIHRHGLIHKDVKPANLLVDADSNVWLTGFGIASRIASERQMPAAPETIAGTLAYMAPEQTGRMNRSIDSRSDLYALGVTFYEMLAGAPPFTAADPMEWIHCHIARQPTPLAQRAIVPGPLSDIIMKLLAKPAEERYQTALGLEADLRRCLADWELRGRIAPFPIGAHDASDRLVISEKLYGREPEICVMLAAFNRVVAHGVSEFVLVSGYSGIGKSAVVNELHKALVSPRGLFASGKCEQYKRDIPYATLAQAFQTLVRIILGKSEAEVSSWRDALREALGPNGGLIVNLIPEMELIIGKQPPMPELAPKDALYRFQRVIRRLIGVFARPEHPLVLFLDDLQWIDASSLTLLEDLVTDPETRHLLLLGAYRDNEVSATHPLSLSLDRIRKAGASLKEIVLAPLGLKDLSHFIAESLHQEVVQSTPLAGLVHAKTGGNPFFCIQFLKDLHKEGLLHFDQNAARWIWGLTEIAAKGYTDNVVEFMAGKLKQLPEATLHVLKRFACAGNEIDLETLAAICEEAPEQIEADLQEALNQGLVLWKGSIFGFLHDRVQQAAYSLMFPRERERLHLKIGRLLLARAPAAAVPERLFEIVSQYNFGLNLIDNPGERRQVAALNLLAGCKAKVVTAYSSALAYLGCGKALLEPESWRADYDLAFGLHIESAECEWLQGKLEEAHLLFLELLAREEISRLDRARIYRDLIEVHTIQGRMQEAVGDCQKCLALFGMQLPTAPGREQIQEEFKQIWQLLGERQIEDLLELPRLAEAEVEATMNAMAVTVPAAVFTSEAFSNLLLCRMVCQSIRHGNGEASLVGYVYFGMIAGATFGNYQAGYSFGKLAYDLADRGFLVWKSRVLVIFGNVINFWTRHMRSNIPYLHAAFTAGLELGDIACACYSCNHLITAMLAVGLPLNEVLEELQKRLAFVRKAHYDDVADLLVSQQRFILNMQGRTISFSSFSDADFDENAFEEKIARSQMALLPFWYDVLKLQARFLSGDLEQALVIGKRAETRLWSSPNHIEVTQFHFFYGLTLAAAHDRVPEEQREELRKTLETYCATLRDWAANCPENFQHKHDLLAAEYARITHRLPVAEELYKSAILLARETGFIQNEGIANELAAMFYMERGLETIGHACLREARNCYARWGAEGKVRQFEARYPWLAEASPLEVAGTIAARLEQLDLLAVVKQQHAISGEILPERLAETLLRIVLESAGAQKAYLFVVPDSELLAVVRPGQGELSVEFNRAPSSGGPCVAGSILNYVKRSRETVILRDASSDTGVFSNDAYLRRARPKSVLCMPISRGTKLLGALYLENNLAADAFTPARRSMLEMISSQAAISLETAGIYSDLQRSEGDLQSQTRILRSILDSMGDGVVVANERGEFLLFNAAAERILGAGATLGGPESWAQKYGLYLPDQVTPYPATELPLAKAIREGALVREAEIFVRHSKRPQGLWLSVSASPLRSENGPVYGGVAVLTDITVRREFEQNLRTAKEAAEAANRTKDQFLAMLSHELRTPLTPILGGINALEGEATPASQETLEMMRRNLMLETRLIDDLLDLNSIAKGKLQFQLKPMDAHQAILGAMETCRQQLSTHQVTLALDASAHFVNGDANRMEQIVRNLLLNAVRFTPSGGTIELRTTNPTAGTFQFSCRDNGQGIEKNDLTRIFNPFEQAGRSVKQGYGGLGLGLAISKAIVEALGGTIAAHSPGRNQGSTFEITLDALPVAVVQPSPGSKPKPSSTTLPPRSPTSAQAPLHILLVEDHVDTRETLARLLQRYGYKVDTAQDAKTAREKAARNQFDMFISDIGLPDGSGYDLIQTLLRHQPIPSISLSGFGMESDFQKSRAAGFSEHLVKPLDFKLLRKTIERLRAGD